MPNKCSQRVGDDGWRSYQCSKPAKVEENGKWWCTIHAPSAVQKHRDKSDVEYKIKRLKCDKERICASQLLEAAMAWYESGTAQAKHLDGLADCCKAYDDARNSSYTVVTVGCRYVRRERKL